MSKDNNSLSPDKRVLGEDGKTKKLKLVPLPEKDKAGNPKLPKPHTTSTIKKERRTKKDPESIFEAGMPDLDEDFNPLDHLEAIPPEELQELTAIDEQQELTPLENALIHIYLAHPTLAKQEIAKLAGYKAQSPKVLIGLFNKVVAKWERGGHAKEIFRKSGVGEARVAMRMRELMMQNLSLPVAKDMVVHASKILEMLGADFADEGFQLVVVRAAKQAKPADTGPHRKAVREDEEKEQITK
jgi:hypothetical protein